MPNVKGKLVADGSHNVIYKAPDVGEVPSVTVESVASGENVRYKLAGAGEVPNAIAEIA
jgi:hypothetical protein